MTGFTPLMNCRCFALLTRSWIRNTTKLAGTKDIAKMTQMDTRTSTDVVILKKTDSAAEDSIRDTYTHKYLKHSPGKKNLFTTYILFRVKDDYFQEKKNKTR